MFTCNPINKNPLILVLKKLICNDFKALLVIDCNVLILGIYLIAQISVVVSFRVAAAPETKNLLPEICYLIFFLHPHPLINAILQFADDVENCSG